MGAGIIAAELGLDLYKIGRSTAISRHIGETEKNLSRTFRSGNFNAILFLDEADALFPLRQRWPRRWGPRRASGQPTGWALPLGLLRADADHPDWQACPSCACRRIAPDRSRLRVCEKIRIEMEIDSSFLAFPAQAGTVRLRVQLIREVQVFPRYAYSGL
jgi:hypothetical protein